MVPRGQRGVKLGVGGGRWVWPQKGNRETCGLKFSEDSGLCPSNICGENRHTGDGTWS